MLSLVQQPSTDRLGEARELLRLVEMGRSSMWAMGLTVLVLLAASFLAVGVLPLAGLLTGTAVSLSLCRYGPHWWPGKR